MIPLLANLLALIAQMSSKETEYTPSSIDKQEIKKETKLIIMKANEIEKPKVKNVTNKKVKK